MSDRMADSHRQLEEALAKAEGARASMEIMMAYQLEQAAREREADASGSSDQ